MWRRLICLALLAWLAITALHAQTPVAPPPEEELFLEVSVNGEASGLILRFTRGKKSGLRSSVQNLRDLELDPKLFGVAAQEEFDLDQIKGLTYTYDAARQSIALRVDDSLRTPLALSARALHTGGPASVTPGMVINYDAFARLYQGRSMSVSNELRYFNAQGVLSSTGVLNLSRELKQYIRLDTAWTHSDPGTMESWQAGDLISGSQTWSRSLRMGGIQWRRRFDLRPDLLTFPAATLAGSAVVPSAVSVYINGVRQIDTNVPSGPFIINQVAGLSGAGQATLVTHDTAGRAIATTVPLYVDTRMLAAGLSDYSIELGVLRRGYGMQSFQYGRAPAVSASLRRGLSDSVTWEAHGEAGRSVLNGGIGGLLRLGQGGVLSASLSASGGKIGNLGVLGDHIDAATGASVIDVGPVPAPAHGTQATLGYQYLSHGLSVDLESQRASAGFSDLGSADAGMVRASNRVNANLALFGGQSVGVSLVGLRTPLQPPARVAAVSYAVALGQGLYFSASAFRDYRNGQARGVFFSLSASFGDRIGANASRSRQNGVHTTTLSMQRTADYGGGFGWGLQSVDNGGTPLRQAQLSYLGNYGQLTAFRQQNGSTASNSLDLTGALVLMDGSVHAARQVGAAFALVSTDGVGGVPVLQENRVVGKTSSSGYLLVPNLNPYLPNQINIDTSHLPLDARIASSGQGFVPARLSGVLARFPVETYAAASVLLHGADGKPLEAGIAVLHVESGARTLVGFDGVAFVDHLAPLNHLQLKVDGKPCVVEFAYQPKKGEGLPTLGPYVCQGVQ